MVDAEANRVLEATVADAVRSKPAFTRYELSARPKWASEMGINLLVGLV